MSATIALFTSTSTNEETFRRVQERLEANRAGGNRERKHMHYLAGSLHCGRCGSRLIYTVNTGRRGGAYEYFMCVGRQLKKTQCDAPHLPVQRVEEAVTRLWRSEHALWHTDALPALRERLIEHLRTIRQDSTRTTGALQRRIDKIQRDRYKWAENALDGIVPADIAREKQATLARQLASLESELKSLESIGVDTEAALNRVIELISDPGHAYAQLNPGGRRTYNQAWFDKIFIDAIPDDPEPELTTSGDRTVIADALEASRQLTIATLKKRLSGPRGAR